MLTHKAVSLIIRWFCKPTDDVKTKREQCILAGLTLLMFLSGLVSICSRVGTGTFLHSPLIPLVTMVGFSTVILLCRCTRKPTCARFLYLVVLYVNIHSPIERGGLANTPSSIFVGLLAPVVSLFLSPTAIEPALWTGIWAVANGSLWYLQSTSKFAFQPPVDLKAQLDVGTLAGIWLGFQYLAVFWYVIYIYTMEFESRKSLEEELNIFMRLSHEIRTPITVINGITHLLNSWEHLSNEQMATLADLSTASRRLGTVVRDLLAFSEPATGTAGVSRARQGDEKDAYRVEQMLRFNLRDVVDTVLSTHLNDAEHQNCCLYTDIDYDVPLEVSGCKDRLSGILDRLVDNAIKFSPDGSATIKVSVERSTDPKIAEFRFEVRDTGIGITQADLTKIFQPFVQSDVTNTREFGGVGLSDAWGWAVNFFFSKTTEENIVKTVREIKSRLKSECTKTES